MKNLINFFFSFDKLMKEKLVIAFFWLSIIVFSLTYFSTALRTIRLGPLASVVDFIVFFGSWLLAIVFFRLICELAVAIFRINNNLSPDGGKSETANIDPIVEARKAAESAAARARELSKTAGDSVRNTAQSAKMSAKEKTESVMGKGSVPSDKHDPTPVKILEPTAAPKKRGRPAGSKKKPAAKAAAKPKVKITAAPKKRGRPAGSKNKTTSTAKKTATTSAPKKRGPKPGSKAPRDAQGRLLKKDGTLRGKPGPKKS
ncbi:DUF4282 domain-containing protein [Hellea sp.]|nr:DUF4282 domain-containing protein [Hellea sp.]